MPMLEIHLLGDFSFSYKHTRGEILDSGRLQSLLVFLLLHRRAPQPRQHVAFLLWPDTSERQAQSNLRNLLHRLRTVFPDIDHFLSIESRTLQWRNDSPFTLDVADFDAALREVEQSQDVIAQETALARAVELYSGDLLPKCDDEWLVAERERLHRSFVAASEKLIDLCEERRAYAKAITYTQHLIHHEPLHELAYQRLMQLYALNGDRASALRAYHSCVTILERELAVAPDLATHQLYERLLSAGTAQADTYEPASALAALTPFVGRHKEWRQLESLWHKSTARIAHFVVIGGEAGIGKTRLAEEFLNWAERLNFSTAIARCYAAEGTLMYAPLIAWLRSAPLQKMLHQLDPIWLAEISRLLPELSLSHRHLPPPNPLTEPWQRQRLFEALARAFLASHQPLLLVIDDLQWCDQDTLEWFHYFVRSATNLHASLSRASGGRTHEKTSIFLVATYRTNELALQPSLNVLLSTLRNYEQLDEIELTGLDAKETGELCTKMIGKPLPTQLAVRLYEEAEGNPLFVVELVRAHLAMPDLSTHDGQVAHPPFVQNKSLPPTVQRVLEGRFTRLTLCARELVALASAIGREFTFPVLAAACDYQEDTLVQGLDELWQQRIIREQGTEAYDFTHGLLREVAYSNLSAARRRFLHRRIAQAIIDVHAHELDAYSGQVAAHFEAGGLTSHAIVWYQRAAEASRKVFSNSEAIIFYQRALALMHEPNLGGNQLSTNAQLLEGLGDLLLLTGHSEEARNAFAQAFQALSTDEYLRRSFLQLRMSDAWYSQNQLGQALQALTVAETILDTQPVATHLAWWQAWVQIQLSRIGVYYWSNQQQPIVELLEKVQSRVVEYGTSAQVARFYHSLVLINWRRDRYQISQETLDFGQRALDTSLQSGDVNLIILMRFSLGFSQLWYGHLALAEQELLTTLALSERIGDVEDQLVCLIYLAITYRKRGQVQNVQDYSLRSMSIAEAIERKVYIATSRANLAWIAWRQRDLIKSKEEAENALALWRNDPGHQNNYPFQWTALWPLIGVALAQDQLNVALEHANRLLESAQQTLPDELTTLIVDALQCAQEGKHATAHSRLLQACQLSQTLGYL